MIKKSPKTVIKLSMSLPMNAIKTFCQRWHIAELSIFGSILHDDFNSESDVDFLYSLKPDTHWSLFDLIQAEEELKKMLNRDVDLVSKATIEKDHNWLRKQNILSSSQVIYDSK